MAQKIQMRRDSVENWLDVNPILARGEWGIAFDGTSTSVPSAPSRRKPKQV